MSQQNRVGRVNVPNVAAVLRELALALEALRRAQAADGELQATLQRLKRGKK